MTPFASLYANKYDTLYSEKDYQGECDLVEAACTRFEVKPKAILDVGCGTGNHVMEFARRGYACTGVDLSAAMLVHAASKSAEENFAVTPHWINGDARDFEAGGPFDLATMMFAVVSYLTCNDDVIRGLRNIRRHLRPGSLFLCDFWYGPAVLSVRPSERVRVLETSEGSTIRAASTKIDSLHHTADVVFRLWSVEGSHYLGETTENHRMRFFFPQEFKLLLEMSGFSLESLTSFPSLEQKPDDTTWNACAVARAI